MEKIILELKHREEEEKIKSLEYFSQVFKRQRKRRVELACRYGT